MATRKSELPILVAELELKLALFKACFLGVYPGQKNSLKK